MPSNSPPLNSEVGWKSIFTNEELRHLVAISGTISKIFSLFSFMFFPYICDENILKLYSQ